MHPQQARLVYRAIQTWRHEPVLDYLHELEESQWYSQEMLRETQWARLMRLLAHAYDSVPFYRARFNSLGLAPDDIRCPADFARIPVLTKKELRAERPAMFSSAGVNDVSAMATSGSSGDPLTVIRDRDSTAYHRAAKYRGHRWFGLDIGDKEARLWGVPVDARTRLRERAKDLLMNRMRGSAYQLDKEGLYGFYRRAMGFQPAYLFGYASLVYEFARFVCDEGLDGERLQLKAAITTSETLHDFQRQAIQAAFGCPTVNEFGSTETGIIAFQCPAGGMHIPVEAAYVEIERDDLAGSPGLGRLVVTDLHNYAMPIIRYDIGDLAAFAHGTCPCGRGLPMLKDIAGRESDVIVTPDGRRIHTILLYYILYGLESRGGGIKKFQVVREAPNRYTTKLVRDVNFRQDDFVLVKRKISEYLGNHLEMHYQFVDAIERTDAGKHRDFVDLVAKDATGR